MFKYFFEKNVKSYVITVKIRSQNSYRSRFFAHSDMVFLRNWKILECEGSCMKTVIYLDELLLTNFLAAAALLFWAQGFCARGSAAACG